MKDHEIRLTIDQLRDIALEYRDAQQLRERIKSVILEPLKRLQELEKELGDSQAVRQKALNL